MIKLYGFARVNSVARGNTRDLRVLWALEELQMPFELVGLDHPKGELKTDEYRRLNPFGQIPVLEDDGVVLTESAAIVIYLAKKAGRLIPADAAGEAQVLRWSFAAMNTIELPITGMMIIKWAGESSGRANAMFVEAMHRFLGALEQWLTGREFIAVESFTVADILMAHALSGPTDETLLAQYPTVLAYRERCKARPAWKRVIDAYCARVEAG